MFILSPSLDEEQENALVEKLANVVKTDGGEVLETKRWGKRRLAYDIKGESEGTYWVMTFKAPAIAPEELRRIVKITEGFLRDIIIDLTDSIRSSKKREEHLKALEARRQARTQAKEQERENRQEVQSDEQIMTATAEE
jgi:small subunit ribosomal protein S6